MESMLDIKGWLITKCKANSSTVQRNPKDPCTVGGALTPDSIPEFVIPRSNDSSRRGSYDAENSNSDHYVSVSRRSSLCSTRTSPGISPSASAIALETRYTSSAPGSPRHEMKGLITGHKTSKSMNCIGDTNSDPLSMAAMSLPHFRSRTTYGFSTLSQSPHTRRKESLFHIQGNGLSSQRLKSLEALSIRGRPDMMDDIIRFSDPEISTKKHTPSVIVTPSASPVCTSVMLSPERQPNHLLATSRLFMKNGNPTHRNFKKNNLYYRRRSSLLGLDADDSNTSSQDSLVTDSPPVQRSKTKVTRQRTEDNDKHLVTLKRHSSPQLRDSEIMEACEAHRSASCSVISNPSPQDISEHGELKFAFQYLAATKQLKLTLIKADNLGGSDKTDSNLNPYVKVYLMPGKLQKQTSELFKHTRKPEFDQNFYFQGMSLEQLHAMTLKITIYHKSHNLRPPELVGKTSLELEDFDLMTENRMWRDLDGGNDNEDLGSLEISMKFEPKEGCLVIAVQRGIGLPEHQIKGPPDPYVKVEVIQPGKPPQKKVTKTKKCTTDPVFGESYNFPVSFKMEDISFTYVTFTVYNHERIKSDEVIGQMGLGYVATQTSEVSHWREMMQNPGHDISKIHSLQDVDDDQKLKLYVHTMDYLPITDQNRDSGSPHNPMPMRDLLKSLLHEELSNNHVVKQEPLKWTQSFQLHHHFHPGEVKVFIKDGKLRLHAKHARGEDDENCDIRESKRSVTLPADIDRSRLHCYSHGHQLVVEAPFLAKSQNEGEEIAIEETDDETADDTSSCFRQDMDLSTFTLDHISVQRCGPDVIVRADHCLDEDGIKVSRSFHREFKIPPNVSSEKLRCRRNSKGMLIFWAPFQAEMK